MRKIIVLVLAAAGLLTAGCGNSSEGFPSGWNASSSFGPGAYRLGSRFAELSADVVARQVSGGIALLDAGQTYNLPRNVCVPGLALAVLKNGRTLFRWAGPTYSACLGKYHYRHFRICIPAGQRSAGPKLKTVMIKGCARPVFPDDSAVHVSITGLNVLTTRRYVVKTASLFLLPRSGAPSEQG